MPRSYKQVEAQQRVDQFAELLSQDIPVPAIRQRMGLTNSSAQGMMLRIRRALGPQAV